MGFSFKPKDDLFFTLFTEGSELVKEAAKLFEQLVENPEQLEGGTEKLIKLERQADEVTEKIVDRLNKTFITPLDREDIYSLAKDMDEVLDSVCGIAERMVLYKTGQPLPNFVNLVEIFVQAASMVTETVPLLKELNSKAGEILDKCHKIKRLESDGDRLYRRGLAHLFSGDMSPIDVIKWKEVYDQLETALDRCERIGKLIRGVVVKYA